VAFGSVAFGVLVGFLASCGTRGNGGFNLGVNGSSGASSGSSGDDGGNQLCLNPPCGGQSSGGLGLHGSNGGSSTVVPPHMDAGVTVDDCAGSSLGASTVAALERGGAVDSHMKWLYPYDLTVFPGGILPPTLQWSAQAAGDPDGVYVHMKSQLFEYRGCFGRTSPTHLDIPQMVWNQALGQSNGSNDPLLVEITAKTGSAVSGPISEHWTIAIGSLKGLIYYNTYTSQIAGQLSMSTGGNGAVMLLKPGTTTPTPFLALSGMAFPIPTGPCISCHSLAANGNMIVAQRHLYPGGINPPGSMSFNLLNGSPNATNPTPLASTTADDWGFSAVYPDGSRILTAGEPQDSTAITRLFPVNNNNNPAMIGPKNNVMYNPYDAGTIPFTGLADSTAMMPMFSPDGTKIVFNDVTNHGGHALVVQDFDPRTNTFSNPVVIYDDQNGNYPGWPFFTPDNKYVVFAMGKSSNFASIPPASFSGVGPVQASASDVAASDLYITCVRTPGTAAALNLANGFKGNPASSYLPYPGRDEHLDFYPTGSPVAAGGYFWVFFTSRRQYGNVMVDATNGNALPDPVFHAETKKIWATALTIDPGEGACAQDSSHPAFLLPGQELASGNIRAFAALAPCTKNGGTCQTGIDCCGGFCTNGTCGAPPMCSGLDNKCSSSQPCCSGVSPPLQCIGGYCAQPVAPM
jgi:hypothetical protein